MNGKESGSKKENFLKAEITLNKKCQYIYHSLFALIIIFKGY